VRLDGDSPAECRVGTPRNGDRGRVGLHGHGVIRLRVRLDGDRLAVRHVHLRGDHLGSRRDRLRGRVRVHRRARLCEGDTRFTGSR